MVLIKMSGIKGIMRKRKNAMKQADKETIKRVK